MCKSLDLHRHIIGIRFSNNSMGQIQMIKTLFISIKKIQNLCSNSSTECVLSKTFRPCLKIPYRLKVIVETVTEGHFSTHFSKWSWLVNKWPLKFFFTQNLISRLFISRYRKNIFKPYWHLLQLFILKLTRFVRE